MIKLLSDALAALDADYSVRVPHAVALAIIKGKSPILAYRNHLDLTLQGLSAKTGLAVSYLSEIERGPQGGLNGGDEGHRQRIGHYDRRSGDGVAEPPTPTRTPGTRG